MRAFFEYMKSKKEAVLVFLCCFIILTVTLYLYQLPLAAVAYGFFLCALLLLTVLLFSFLKYRKDHEILKNVAEMDYRIIEQLPETDSLLEQDYQNIIRRFIEEEKKISQQYENDYSELKDFYTIWAHQIKIPISAMSIRLQSDDSDSARALRIELAKIDQYVDMMLGYMRMESESSDFLFRKYSVDTLISETVRKFSSQFIMKNLRFSYEPIGYEFITDKKWFCFVLEQVFSNALKYTSEGEIAVYMEGENLCIRDSGIGIGKEDLPRVFEKGYTGLNGRLNQKSTGIGLYLCKRVCDRLNHQISIDSEVGKYTVVRINLHNEQRVFE